MAETKLYTPSRGQGGGKGEVIPPPWGSEVWKSSEIWKLRTSEERMNGGRIYMLDQRVGGFQMGVPPTIWTKFKTTTR